MDNAVNNKVSDLTNQVDQLKSQLDTLQAKIANIDSKRIKQQNILPDVIKMRHIGEGVRFIRSGLAASKPTKGEKPMQGSPVYFAYDTNVLYIFNGTAWKSTTLT